MGNSCTIYALQSHASQVRRPNYRPVLSGRPNDTDVIRPAPLRQGFRPDRESGEAPADRPRGVRARRPQVRAIVWGDPTACGLAVADRVRPWTKSSPPRQEAIAGITDGMSLSVGGFGLCGIPSVLIAAIHDAGITDLEAVSNNCGVDDWGLGILLRDKRIRRMVALLRRREQGVRAAVPRR